MPKSKSKPAASRSIAEEIAALRAMQVPELVERYEAVFSKPPRVKHRDWLWRRIAWKIQEQRFGGLSQDAKRRIDELIAELNVPLTGERAIRADVQLVQSEKVLIPCFQPSRPAMGTAIH